MNQRTLGQMLMIIFLAVSLIACKDKEETNATTDARSTNTATTESDALKVGPNAYKLLADSLGIRMLEVNLNPGDSVSMHHHPTNALYVVQGGGVTFYAKDGSKTEVNLPSGATMVRPDEWHAGKNTGNNAIKVILFEINRNGPITSPDAKTSATTSEVYKLKNDSLGVRIIEVNAKPGQSIAMHSHPVNALYVIDGGTAEFTMADGKKQAVELTSGMSQVSPAESHSVKNTGKTTVKAILVEVYRGM